MGKNKGRPETPGPVRSIRTWPKEIKEMDRLSSTWSEDQREEEKTGNSLSHNQRESALCAWRPQMEPSNPGGVAACSASLVVSNTVTISKAFSSWVEP